MPPFVGAFTLSRLERVISGPGTLGAIADEFDRRARSRVVVVTGRTLGGSVLLDGVKAALGDRCVAVFTGARQHVPSDTVQALTALLREVGADGLVSFGGGSPIDAAKAAVHAILTEDESRTGGAAEALLHIALPTTLSAGEFTSIAGITDEGSRIKRAVTDPRIAPRAVITDPNLTVETPDWLWAATGVRAMDHAVESIYSVRHHPFSDALASKAIALLVSHLPGSIRCADPDRISHRGHCQLAAWLSVFGISNTGFGLSHALGHQIGPRWDVPHGFTSCIMLPHAMRFMADVAPERFGPIAEGLGVPFDAADPRPSALSCATRVAEFIAQFDVPTRLRDAAVPRDEAVDIAGVVHAALEHAEVVGRPLAVAELAAMLSAAY
jgi:alcohol dehydrogenase class IV